MPIARVRARRPGRPGAGPGNGRASAAPRIACHTAMRDMRAPARPDRRRVPCWPPGRGWAGPLRRRRRRNRAASAREARRPGRRSCRCARSPRTAGGPRRRDLPRAGAGPRTTAPSVPRSQRPWPRRPERSRLRSAGPGTAVPGLEPGRPAPRPATLPALAPRPKAPLPAGPAMPRTRPADTRPRPAGATTPRAAPADPAPPRIAGPPSALWPTPSPRAPANRPPAANPNHARTIASKPIAIPAAIRERTITPSNFRTPGCRSQG